MGVWQWYAEKNMGGNSEHRRVTEWMLCFNTLMEATRRVATLEA